MNIFEETYKLNSGIKIPRIVLGVWEIPDDQTPAAVEAAIKMG